MKLRYLSVCLLAEDRGPGCCSSPLQLHVQESNSAFRLPFHCELNGWVLPIEVLVESFQEVISMRPDGKGIVYIPKPHLGLVGRGLQVFDEDVRHDSERGEPIAAPCTCSKKDPPNWKYVDRRHSSTRWQSSGIGMLVRSSSVSSCCR